MYCIWDNCTRHLSSDGCSCHESAAAEKQHIIYLGHAGRRPSLHAVLLCVRTHCYLVRGPVRDYCTLDSFVDSGAMYIVCLFTLYASPLILFFFAFYSARNARIASAVLAIPVPSVRPSVTRRYCVKTTARSTVQFAPLDSKMCLVL